jgi:hypothetical protein
MSVASSVALPILARSPAAFGAVIGLPVDGVRKVPARVRQRSKGKQRGSDKNDWLFHGGFSVLPTWLRDGAMPAGWLQYCKFLQWLVLFKFFVFVAVHSLYLNHIERLV